MMDQNIRGSAGGALVRECVINNNPTVIDLLRNHAPYTLSSTVPGDRRTAYYLNKAIERIGVAPVELEMRSGALAATLTFTTQDGGHHGGKTVVEILFDTKGFPVKDEASAASLLTFVDSVKAYHNQLVTALNGLTPTHT